MKREPLEVECWFLIPLVRDSDSGLHQALLWRLLEEALSDTWGGWTGPETMRWGRKAGRCSGRLEAAGIRRSDYRREPKVHRVRAAGEAGCPPRSAEKGSEFIRSTGDSLERSWTARTDCSRAGRRLSGVTLVYHGLLTRRPCAPERRGVFCLRGL